MPESQRASSVPLWPLPLAIALLFLGGVHLAWWLSIRDGLIPACVPVWDGCVSISRAARHGLGNHLFRLAMLPCAALHLLNWWLMREWVRDADSACAATLCMGLGLGSGLALAVYATFLGTDGETYRFLRRYGVIVYFGFGFLAQLGFMRLSMRSARLQPRIARAMVGLCAAMLLLGVASVAATSTLPDDSALRERVENALEWQLGWLLLGWFALQAWAWRADGYGLRLTRRGTQ
ncbi:hypothetical protein [Luteimonas aquatica]|uniref:hypothetical protein n=1 Tax=Luteimonas aquatica TaxID=450364 RepID=UPI001F56C093|nr:hypothetical protein [Luteimonas aquatica]